VSERLLTVVFNAGVGVSIVSTVLSLGLSFSVSQVAAPLRRVRLVIAVVVVNVALIPAGAWGIARLVGLTDDAVTGITLTAIGAAGAAGLKAAQLSKRADMALALSLVVVLQLLNLVAVPLWAGRLVAGATISTRSLLQSLLLLILLPLVIGMVARIRRGAGTDRWQERLVRIANVALAIAIVSGVAGNREALSWETGSRTLLAAAVIVVASVALGAMLGGRDLSTRTTTALITGKRFSSLGLIIIGTQLGGEAAILGPAIAYSLVDLLIAIGLALVWARRSTAADRSAFGR
jgi:BASS family bile acid:Na+ symporter